MEEISIKEELEVLIDLHRIAGELRKEESKALDDLIISMPYEFARIYILGYLNGKGIRQKTGFFLDLESKLLSLTIPHNPYNYSHVINMLIEEVKNYTDKWIMYNELFGENEKK